VSSRLERHVAEVWADYLALPEDFRRRFEAGLIAARDTLEVSEEVKLYAPELPGKFLTLCVMIFSDGKMGGNWTKVHTAFANGAPPLYPQIERMIPRDDGLSDMGL